MGNRAFSVTAPLSTALVAASLTLTGAAQAQTQPPAQTPGPTPQQPPADKPKPLQWTTYRAGSSGHAQVVAITRMLKAKLGLPAEVNPGRNDVVRLTPLRDGADAVCACGIASYYAQEGVFLFGKKGWGPQPIRLLMTSRGSFGLGLVVAGDAKVEKWEDLKGKRIAMVDGSPAINIATRAFLAFGGLSWGDVTMVHVATYPAAIRALTNGDADAAFTSTISPLLQTVTGSGHRGVRWMPLPVDDAAAWARLRGVAPYFVPIRVNVGYGIARAKPWAGATYPHPILVSGVALDSDTVYRVVKAMIEHHEIYTKGVHGTAGWALKRQPLIWVLPYHEGAIRAFQEKGVWTDAAQAHNDKLIERQTVLATAWKKFVESSPPDDGFTKAWMAARQKALTEAGMPAVFP